MQMLSSYILSPISLVAFIAASTLTTIMGPFGTYGSMTLGERVLYWPVLIAVSMIMGMGMRSYVDRVFADRNFWVRATVNAGLFSVTFTPVVLGMNLLFLEPGQDSPMPVWMIYLAVLSVPLAINPLVYLAMKVNGRDPDTLRLVSVQEAAEWAAQKEDTRPRLLDRLTGDIGDDLIRLTVEDHFVHVYMSEGSERLRMRFGDALAEVDCVPGLRVHRSHWVAEHAVAGHEQQGGKTMLRLTDGSIVPVSRNYRRAVEQAGLLANVSDAPSSAQSARKQG